MNKRAQRAEARGAGERVTLSTAHLMKPGGLLRRLFDEVIDPNEEQIVEITCDSRIPVVVFEPLEALQQELRSLGWTGETVFAMPDSMRTAKIDAWLTRPKHGAPDRLFVWMRGGTLLLNQTPDGWCEEPGSGSGGVFE